MSDATATAVPGNVIALGSSNQARATERQSQRLTHDERGDFIDAYVFCWRHGPTIFGDAHASTIANDLIQRLARSARVNAERLRGARKRATALREYDFRLRYQMRDEERLFHSDFEFHGRVWQAMTLFRCLALKKNLRDGWEIARLIRHGMRPVVPSVPQPFL